MQTKELNWKFATVLTYTGMSKCISVVVDYGGGNRDVLSMAPLRLLLHLNWLILFSQNTQTYRRVTKFMPFKKLCVRSHWANQQMPSGKGQASVNPCFLMYPTWFKILSMSCGDGKNHKNPIKSTFCTSRSAIWLPPYMGTCSLCKYKNSLLANKGTLLIFSD